MKQMLNCGSDKMLLSLDGTSRSLVSVGSCDFCVRLNRYTTGSSMPLISLSFSIIRIWKSINVQFPHKKSKILESLNFVSILHNIVTALMFTIINDRILACPILYYIPWSVCFLPLLQDTEFHNLYSAPAFHPTSNDSAVHTTSSRKCSSICQSIYARSRLVLPTMDSRPLHKPTPRTSRLANRQTPTSGPRTGLPVQR